MKHTQVTTQNIIIFKYKELSHFKSFYFFKIYLLKHLTFKKLKDIDIYQTITSAWK